jgi:hypothetical protein
VVAVGDLTPGGRGSKETGGTEPPIGSETDERGGDSTT